jgi:D-alanine-D-alanine ligase
MDKALARAVFQAAGLGQTDYRVVRRSEWRSTPAAVLNALEQTFDYPLFVKPVNLGSSIGITKAHAAGQLRTGLDLAAEFDCKIMVEASVEGARELECAVLGNEDPTASGVGEIIPGAEFYDYNTKYIDDRSELRIPAELDEAVTEEIREMAVRAFRAIDCRGLARVDFLLRPGGEVLLNEINTMPGFTPISMYPKLWQVAGLSYADLIDRLIKLGIEQRSDRRDLKTTPD